MKRKEVLFSLIIIALTVVSCGGESEEDKQYQKLIEQENANIAARQARQDSIRSATEFKWQYSRSEDAMGNLSGTATVKSQNKISLPFPYDDTDYGYLTIRNHSEYGRDIYFRVAEGQIHNDKVTLRFDDGKAFNVNYLEPADDSSEMIFLQGYKNLVNKLQDAKKLALQVTFYNAGSHIFEFDVSGLDLNKLK